MTNEQRNQLIALRKALDNFVVKIADTPAEINENQIVVRSWKPDTYIIGDVRNYHNVPYKCVQAHDSTANADWTPEATPALWMQYHGTTLESARTWVAPTGAQDMYKAGEYMIYTDGKTYKCLSDTTYSPTDYAQAWEVQGGTSGGETGGGGEATIAAWVQPAGAQDAYKKGDIVTHNGKTWESTADNNVWEPGVYGWVEK